MKVIIADDHPVVRQGLRQMLAVEQDLQVVGEARNGQEVVDLSRRIPWEVAVLDYNMPGKNGLELIKELRQRYPGRAVLILSMYPEDRYAVRALKAGASGYLTKDSASEQLVSALRKIAAGGVHISDAAAASLLSATQPEHGSLSDREFEVLRLLVEGLGPTDIGERLHLSVKTVSTHKARILEKLGLDSTADLVRYAMEHKLFQ